MKSEVCQIRIRKEAYKFSVAHMTVFPNGEKESLHGHNYTTDIGIDLKIGSLSEMVSFSIFKDEIRKICATWDEKVLLPRICPYLKIQAQTSSELDFLLCGKRYVLPSDEVLLLETDNITVENLAQIFGSELKKRLKLKGNGLSEVLVALHVTIEESPGQGATFSWSSF